MQRIAAKKANCLRSQEIADSRYRAGGIFLREVSELAVGGVIPNPGQSPQPLADVFVDEPSGFEPVEHDTFAIGFAVSTGGTCRLQIARSVPPSAAAGKWSNLPLLPSHPRASQLDLIVLVEKTQQKRRRHAKRLVAAIALSGQLLLCLDAYPPYTPTTPHLCSL